MNEQLANWSNQQLTALKATQRQMSVFYQSNDEAIQALQSINLVDTSLKSIANVLNQHLAIACIPVMRHHTLAIYDYDQHIYMFEHNHFLRDCLVALIGESSTSMINDVKMTLLGMRHQLMRYLPLPNYCLVVENGIYNALTQSLTEHDPSFVSLAKVSASYYSSFANQQKLEQQFQQFVSLFEDQSGSNVLSFIKNLLLHSQDFAYFVISQNTDNQLQFSKTLLQLFGGLNTSRLSLNDLMKYEYHMMLLNQSLVLSVDNSDVRLKDSLFLDMIYKKPMVIRRLYTKPVYSLFNATIVECYDRMPIFEKSSELEKHIQFLHLSNNSQQFECTQEFADYLLFRALNETYYLYNKDHSVQQRTLPTSQDDVDQFFMHAYQHNLLQLEYVPASYLYGAYFDYMLACGKNRSILSARGFSFKAQAKLPAYGYEFTTQASRPASLSENHQQAWQSLAESYEHLQSVINENKTTRLFKKVDNQSISTAYESCSVFKYFHLEGDYKEYQLKQIQDVIQTNEELKIERLEKEIEEKQRMLEQSRQKLHSKHEPKQDEVPVQETETPQPIQKKTSHSNDKKIRFLR
jgi:hypothetical protein